jgi:hypothetical protein
MPKVNPRKFSGLSGSGRKLFPALNLRAQQTLEPQTPYQAVRQESETSDFDKITYDQVSPKKNFSIFKKDGRAGPILSIRTHQHK